MSRISKLGCAILALLLLTVNAYAWGDNDKDKDSVCETTAKTMFKACRNDVRDDYLTTLANCANISSWEDRWACYSEAADVRGEETESCADVREAREEACEVLGENRYDPDPLLDPNIEFIHPDQVPGEYSANPFVSVVAGHTYVLRAGEEGQETVIVHVTDDTREIQDVDCRVVVDIVLEWSEDDGEYEAVEVTDDWFAQDTDGNVYYCGEIARNYEDGVLRDLDGSFEAGMDFAKAGLLIKAFPIEGAAHRLEFALGEAEDIIQYLSIAASPEEENLLFPCNDGCLKTFDFAPIDPEATEFKYYKPGVGFVLAVAMEEGEITGEREELVCTGDSLDEVLTNPDCGFPDDMDSLLDELCKLSPDVYCD